MKITVEKYTGIDALHTANSFTTGHESKMSLRKAYSLMHSPIRTQRFYVYMEDIPLFCASQFVRSNAGVQWYQRTKRTDRGGEDFRKECDRLSYSITAPADSIEALGFFSASDDEQFTYEISAATDNLRDAAEEIKHLPERFDRYAPTSLMGDMNAEAIINMSRKRLCSTASKETREIWEQVIAEVAKVDPDLALFCVKPCIFSGGICREHKSCGFNKTELFQKTLEQYKKLFI